MTGIWRPQLVMVCVLALAAWSAHAQSQPAKDTKDAKEKKDEKAEAEAAAMERARRLAANPMRLIIEASRTRRRGEPEPAATAATPAAPTPPAATAGATTAPASPPPAAAAAPAAPAPEAAVRVTALLGSQLSQSASTTPAPSLEVSNQLKPVVQPVVPPASLPQITASLPPPPESIRPTIVSRVDPEVPQRLLADLQPNTVVTAELTIQRDGSVSEVSVVNANPRTLSRFVVAALQQWRFAPLPSTRQWRVELLFRPE